MVQTQRSQTFLVDGLPLVGSWGAVPTLLAPVPDEPPVRQDDVFTRYHDYRARILFQPLVEAVMRAP